VGRGGVANVAVLWVEVGLLSAGLSGSGGFVVVFVGWGVGVFVMV